MCVALRKMAVFSFKRVHDHHSHKTPLVKGMFQFITLGFKLPGDNCEIVEEGAGYSLIQ